MAAATYKMKRLFILFFSIELILFLGNLVLMIYHAYFGAFILCIINAIGTGFVWNAMKTSFSILFSKKQ